MSSWITFPVVRYRKAPERAGMCIVGKVGLRGREFGEEIRCDDGSNTMASSQTWCCLVVLGVSADWKQVLSCRWRCAINTIAHAVLDPRSFFVFIWVIFKNLGHPSHDHLRDNWKSRTRFRVQKAKHLRKLNYSSRVHKYYAWNMKLGFWSYKPNTNAFFYPNLICSDGQFFVTHVGHESLCNTVVSRQDGLSWLVLFHWVELCDTAVSAEWTSSACFAADSLSGCSNFGASKSWVWSTWMHHQASTEHDGLWGGFHVVGCVQGAFLLIHWIYLPICLCDRTMPEMFKSTEHLLGK